MENLKIHLYESGKSKPDKVVTLPLSKLDIARQLLPADTKKTLEREGIDIKNLNGLSSKSISKGVLIEAESDKEKLVLSVE